MNSLARKLIFKEIPQEATSVELTVYPTGWFENARIDYLAMVPSEVSSKGFVSGSVSHVMPFHGYASVLEAAVQATSYFTATGRKSRVVEAHNPPTHISLCGEL